MQCGPGDGGPGEAVRDGGTETSSQAGTCLNCVLKEKALGRRGRVQKGGIL